MDRELSTTYSALRARAAQVAGAIRTMGIEPGDRVAIMLERGSEAAAAFFGVVAAGAIAIIVNESLRPRQIEYIIGHAAAKILIADPEIIAALPRALATTASVVDVRSLVGPEAFAPVGVTRDVPAQISYTSGSTGAPKGVVLSHGNLLAVTRAVVGYLGLRHDDRIASLLPFSFVYGFNQLLCAVGCEGTLVIERSSLAQQIVATLRAQRCTVLAAVPSLWAQILSVQGFSAEPLPDLRIATNAGAGIAAGLVRRIRAAQPQASLILMYGLTEALRSTYLPPEEVDAHPDAIGRPIPGSEIFVLNEHDEPCATGEIGELVQRGPTVALGYWNDPVSTAAVFRSHPGSPAANNGFRVVHSGDLVRRDESGLLYFVGRRDHMIKTLGYRVSPEEVCAVLYASRLVTQAVVASEACSVRGERIVACVVLADGATVGQLDRHCRIELPRYMQPARYDTRDELPRLPNGKFDLSTIRAQLAGKAESGGS